MPNAMATTDCRDVRIRSVIAKSPSTLRFDNSFVRFRRGDLRLAAGRDLGSALLEAGGGAAAARLDPSAEEVDVLLAGPVHFLEDLLRLGNSLLAGWRELCRVLLQAGGDLAAAGLCLRAELREVGLAALRLAERAAGEANAQAEHRGSRQAPKRR